MIKFHCPDKEKHTECPKAYLSWHEWAKTMGRTHKQIKCDSCNLYTIWIKK